MRILVPCMLAVFPMFVVSRSAEAALIGGPDIVAPPPSVNNENPQGGNPGGGLVNTHQQGFDEQQNVVLPGNVEHDFGVIPAGTRVDSHMIFYNFADKANDGNPYSDGPHDWHFSGEILGVMSDEYGVYEVASSPTLGAPGTAYPTEAYQYRGFEPGNYTVTSGSVLTVTCGGYAPGDWVRVITAASDPPAPAVEITRLTSTGTTTVLAWESNQSNLVFMVESSTNLSTGSWSPAPPTSQWWFSGMVWTNTQPSKEWEFFRVQGSEQ